MKIVCPHCGSLEIAGAPGCAACPQPIPSGPWFAIEAYLRRQQIWSTRTFGEGPRTAGIVKHIEKELAEILAKPLDLTEWIDVVILALDGYWRAGGQPDGVMDYLQAKQNVNFTRTWPAPTDDGEPTEHDRSAENQDHNPGLAPRLVSAAEMHAGFDEIENLISKLPEGSARDRLRDWVFAARLRID
jgi:hypothetical protein